MEGASDPQRALDADVAGDGMKSGVAIELDFTAALGNAAEILAAAPSVAYYAWNGIAQSVTATQTNRAISLLYALTGSYGARGGNVTKCAGPPAALTAPVENITTAQADAATTTTRGRRSARPSRLRRRQPECLISTDSGVIRALIVARKKNRRSRITVGELAHLTGFRQCD